MQKRIKQIIRTVSKVKGLTDPKAMLLSNSEVEDYVSKFINDGWVLLHTEVLNRTVSYMDKNNAGVEIMYVLYLPEDVTTPEVFTEEVETVEEPKRRGRPPKSE